MRCFLLGGFRTKSPLVQEPFKHIIAYLMRFSLSSHNITIERLHPKVGKTSRTVVNQHRLRCHKAKSSNWQRTMIFFVLAGLCTLTSTAQSTLEFQNFTQKDGLSSNYILFFHQDHQGFMWIGTEGGLSRFDGQHFLEFNFDPEDPETLDNDWVIHIYEDSQYNLWVGTQRGLNLLYRATGKIERIPWLKDGQKMQGPVKIVSEVSKHRFWIHSKLHGLFELKKVPGDPNNWHTEHFDFEDTLLSLEKQERENEFLMASTDELWFNDGETIKRLHIPSQKLTYFNLPSNLESESKIISGKHMDDGNIILYTADALFILNTKAKSPQIRYLQSIDFPQIKDIFYTAYFQGNIQKYSEDVLLLWNYRDPILLNVKTGAIELMRSRNQTTKEFSSDEIRHIYKDSQDNYWIGTAGSGIYYGQKSELPFVFYQNDPADPNSVSQGQVRTFVQDHRGDLWLGILNHGLDRFVYTENQGIQKKQSVVSIPNQPNTLASDRMVKIIQGPENSIWIATLTHGVVKMDSTRKQFIYINEYLGDSTFPSDHRIWALEKDLQGYIWAGTWEDGLLRIDPRIESIQRFRHDPTDENSLLNNNIRYLFADRNGILWIGTDDGLDRYDPKSQQFMHYLHDPNDPTSLSDNLVWAIYQDQKDDLWIGTDTGLNRLDQQSQKFERFYKKNGLPDNTIYGILGDDEGILWVSTEKGLARQLPPGSDAAFFPLGLESGLATTSFLPKAFLNSSNSEELFFGSTDGFLSVKPSVLQIAAPQPKMAIHSLSTFNPYLKQEEQFIDYFLRPPKGPMKLDHQDQSVTITLADLNWMNNKGLRYEYQLTGFNSRWMPLAEDMQINFSNLSPGSYQLRTRARNTENISSEPAMLVRLRVYPPWWKSMWAYICYFLLASGIILVMYRFQLRRQIEKQEAQNLRTLNTLKNRLYTNITHEFRTPLTIIKGMIGKINQNPDQWATRGTQMINRNADELLSLVNQILELRKLKAGKLHPKMVQRDILPFIKYIIESFHSMGSEKGIQLVFRPGFEELVMDHDPDMIKRIVSNLLSNAIKYTENGGEVSLIVDIVPSPENIEQEWQQSLLITVTDDGLGIPEDQLPFIFNRFYRADQFDGTKQKEEGSGIGLSLTHELIHLLGGTIKVESTLGEGSRFLVWLPLAG